MAIGKKESLGAQFETDLLKKMLLIRRFEEKAAQMYGLKKIGGFCHLYVGQEAVAVGSIGATRPGDYIITAYRDHGHAIARGMQMTPLFAELYGKSTGCSRGKGGSMHFFDKEKNFFGGHAIVAGHIPLAVGLGWAAKYRGEDRVAILEEIAAGCAGKERGRDLFLVPDRQDAIRLAFSRARPGDSVLLLGKGHEGSIIGPSGASAWNEREEAEAALRALGFGR